MIEDELVKIWQSSPNQERVKFERSRLMIDLQSSLDRFHKLIRNRDLTETIAAIIVIPVFAYYVYIIPHTLSKIASGLISLWAIYVIVRLRNVRKHKPGAFTETYHNYLYQTRAYINVQKKLLDTVLYWYLVPGFAFILLFLAGFIGIPGKETYIIKTGAGAVVVGIIAYFLNRRAVKKHILPRLEKVDELIKVIEKES
jgi:hypothetical protein